MSDSKIYPFNNNIETGLRMLTVLSSAYPQKYDLDHLVYFDYMVVHSADINSNIQSLHPAVPNRSGEIFIRRNLIQNGLEIFLQKGLINKYYNDNGIQYSASESSIPFLDALSESYTSSLIHLANWVVKEYGNYELKDLRELMRLNLEKNRSEFNLEIIK
ncbi:hypothetical protein QWZ08_26255 [Ferruginibacter paludis]|uniref:ABC-three component system middle component 2 n=1 Tax=Ferruginibacter paludis TaxID=1310417 RepID=UPI0025B31149|nr:ABC-three component system middle component 2 [Ferruginibacter paludis]MDN3659175.1 hypothetical protein [Ferruginibacter paludis]